MSWKGVLVGVISVGALSFAACNPGYSNNNTPAPTPLPVSNNSNPNCSGQVDGGTVQDRANMERMIQKFCDDMQKQLDAKDKASKSANPSNTLEHS